MSKKVNNAETTTATTATTSTEKTVKTAKTPRIVDGSDLKALFEKYPNASVRKLAQSLDITYGIMLKASKAPVAGQPYDPEATNWDALVNECAKRNKNFLEDGGLVDWAALNEGRASSATLIKDMDAFKVGQKVYLRRNNTTPYEIVYKTDTHVVILLEGTSEPQAWKHETFLFNGPVFEPRTEKKEGAAE